MELYKKYRPSRWDDVIGQQKVANSLKTAVKSNRIPTAYIFSGPRGCGKTTAALLLAKSINCENLTKDGNPCNECEYCVGIDNGSLLGFNYISMANKGSADDVRAIVQQARLNQPLKKQVWILDEVHNLSKAAFDALLIPLEDKNMPSLFIFCSTEIDKIPQTILSRSQQRKFSLVSSEEMTKHLEKIIELEGLELSEEDVKAAVRMGRGSVRDTLSALDSIVDTGEAASSFGGQLLEALAAKDLTKIYGVLAEANKESVDFREFAEQLFEDLRDLLLLASGVDKELVGTPPVMNPAAVVKGLHGKNGILLIMNEVGDGITQMSMGMDARIRFEISLLKGVQELARRIKLAGQNK